ncbi:HupE/UreJ family protein [Paracoccus sp. SSJ]|uniref:HupE/UreJ family protein n=1 Tax=Paracoccus sp. SSJ TaxID=3050636 RepID=UPI00254C9DD7|nr:HupE/UreJ family protein [Paracoccus sp. SSJ]MDK8873812.1 HupE/UreJ family protein [Paracoccus sp. SSJ]
MRIALTLFLLLSPAVALAHPGHLHGGGFASGFSHPLLGLDHVFAMIAVGLWAASLGGAAAPILLLAFPLAMIAGGLLGAADVPLPAVEAGIAASSIVIGVAVMLALRPPLWAAGLVVAAFAVFHGHAHGTEMPAAGNLAPYAAGFVLATLLLHLAGLGIGRVGRLHPGPMLSRGLGAVIALVGSFALGGLAG